MHPRTLETLKSVHVERLVHIEFRLWFMGQVSRIDLVDRFGIGGAVATRDFAAYKDLAKDNVVFDDKKKVYRPSSTFKPVFDHDPDRVLTALSKGFGDGNARASRGYVLSEFPLRLNQPDLGDLAIVTRAITQRKVVQVRYVSYSSGTSKRDLVPYGIVDSGTRWHVRAFDRTSGEFRDFALNRIDKPVILDDAIQTREEPQFDDQWLRMVSLELLPHPAIAHPEIVERDYGMQDGHLVLNVRASVAGYVLQHWNVDCSTDHSLDPAQYRLWLRHSDKVLYGVNSAILAPGLQKQGSS